MKGRPAAPNYPGREWRGPRWRIHFATDESLLARTAPFGRTAGCFGWPVSSRIWFENRTSSCARIEWPTSARTEDAERYRRMPPRLGGVMTMDRPGSVSAPAGPSWNLLRTLNASGAPSQCAPRRRDLLAFRRPHAGMLLRQVPRERRPARHRASASLPL